MRTIFISEISGFVDPQISMVIEIWHDFATAHELEQAMRESVAAWLDSPEGQEHLAEVEGDFNWGDWLDTYNLEDFVPQVSRTKDLLMEQSIIFVNHDEVLATPKQREKWRLWDNALPETD